jgi:RNA polymerase sigma-70 factor (ECF subfamily)
MTRLDFGALYAEHRTSLLRYLRSRGASPELAEELTQEAFAHALAAPSYKEEGKPLAWLFRIASNLLVDHRKSWRVRQHFAADLTAWGEIVPHLATNPELPDEAVIRGDWLAEVRGVLATAAAERLPARHWQVLRMRMVEGLSVAETAAALAATPAAVKTVQSRAVRALADDPRIQALRRDAVARSEALATATTAARSRIGR